MLTRTRLNRTNYPAPETIAQSLVENKGPLPNRRAIERGKVEGIRLHEAIALAEAGGMSPGWRVWHFDQVDDKWIFDSDIFDALTTIFHQRGLLPQDLDPRTMGADFDFAPLVNLKASDFSLPVTVTVDSQSIEVPVSGLFALKFRSSPYEAVKWYIEQIWGAHVASEFRPYHMTISKRETLKDSSLVGEVIGKKLARILESDPKSDLFSLSLGVTIDQLSEPFVEKVGSASLVVTPQTIFCHYGALQAVQHGLRFLGHENFADSLKSYHRDKASNSTWALDSHDFKTILVRYLALLKREHYNGNTVNMVRHFTPSRGPKIALVDKLHDPITGEERAVPISVETIFDRLDKSRWEIVTTYLRESGEYAILAALKPYHLEGGVKLSPELDFRSRKELLLRHMNSILSAPPYNGNLLRFVDTVTGSELSKPFRDVVAGIPFDVSTSSLCEHFGQSPRKMIRAYLTYTNQTDNLEHIRSESRRFKKPLRGRTVHQEMEILFGAIDALRAEGAQVISYHAIREPYTVSNSRISPSLSWRRWSRRVRQGSKTEPLKELIGAYEEERGLKPGSVIFESAKKKIA